MMFNRLNKVKIHCWGGLGSQLNAWAMAEAVRQKFKNKSVEIILHTGGVTKRTSELQFLATKFEIKIIEDFQNYKELDLKLHTFPTFITKTLKFTLDKLRVVMTDETGSILYRMKNWTLSLRGHYSNETLSDQIIYSMFTEIMKNKSYKTDATHGTKNNLGMHYRLGDLLRLSQKSFVNPETLGRFYLDFFSAHIIEDTYVYSDSPSFAQSSLGVYLDSSTKYLDKDIWSTLIELCNHKYFIGTNSKISIWVALFRMVKDFEANICLPISMKDSLSKVYPKIIESPSAIFY